MSFVIERTQSGDTTLRYKSTLPWITKTCEYAKHGEALQLKRSFDSIANSLHYLIQAFEHPFPNVKFNHVPTTEIKKLLNRYDKISVKFLKLFSQSFTRHLTYVCNKSFSRCNFTSPLNLYVLKPLYGKITEITYLISYMFLYLRHFTKSSKGYIFKSLSTETT